MVSFSVGHIASRGFNRHSVGTATEYELEQSWAPAWNTIGKYMQYNSRVQEFARSLIYQTFSLGDSQPFPSVSTNVIVIFAFSILSIWV